MKQKGLGRGLDAIFGSDANPIDAKLKPCLLYTSPSPRDS